MREHNSYRATSPSPWIALVQSVLRFKVWLLGAPVLAAVVFGGAFQFMPDEYTAVLKVAPSNQVQLYMWGLRDPGVTGSVISQLDLEKHYDEMSDYRARKKLLSNVRFVSNLQDAFIDVRVTDHDPVMASKIANAYGEALVDLLTKLHLTPVSNAIYDLQSRRAGAVKNLERARMRLGEAEVKKALPYISAPTRLGLVAMAHIQTETTLSTLSNTQDLARRTLDQNELPRLQESLLSIQSVLNDNKISFQHAGLPVANLIMAAGVLQDEAYWESMVSQIDRRVEVLRTLERDELHLIPSTPPNFRSGPPRGVLTAAAAILAFLLTLTIVLIREQSFKSVAAERI